MSYAAISGEWGGADAALSALHLQHGGSEHVNMHKSLGLTSRINNRPDQT